MGYWWRYLLACLWQSKVESASPLAKVIASEVTQIAFEFTRYVSTVEEPIKRQKSEKLRYQSLAKCFILLATF